jgi:hypothetical protein
MLIEGRDPKSDALKRARGFDSFKAENKNNRNRIQFKKERFEFQIALLYIIS